MTRVNTARTTRRSRGSSPHSSHRILGISWVWLGGAALLILAAGIFVLNAGSQTGGFSKAAAVGTAVPSLGGQHVGVGIPHAAYNSTPPSSGPHWDTPADWGVYQEPLPSERWVHNLEHGGIVILYHCPQGCSDLTGKLDTLFKTAPRSKLGNVKLLIMPDNQTENRLTLVAWTYYLTLSDYDDAIVRDFIMNHLDKAPEQVT
jgi:uncharacterized protein DUF3105